MRTILSLLAVASITVLPCANAGAQVRLPSALLCLTFGQSTDLFAGEASPRRSPGGYFGLSMIEQTYDRAAYGSLVLNNGIYRIGMTKQTNTASVSYQCDIGSDSLVGQCSVTVFSALTSTASLRSDVGTLSFGACRFDTPQKESFEDHYPLGEGS